MPFTLEHWSEALDRVRALLAGIPPPRSIAARDFMAIPCLRTVLVLSGIRLFIVDPSY